MSKFEGLGGIPIRTNKFEGLGGIPVQQNINQSQQEDEGYLTTIGKSAITGISRFLDTPQSVGILAEKATRGYAKKLGETAQGNTSLGENIKGKLQEYGNSPEVISTIKPASQRVRDFVGGEGNLDARPVGAGQRIASDIADFTTSLANPLGPLGYGGKAIASLDTLKKLGTTGAAIGGTSGVLKEVGIDPLKADIGASLAIPLGKAGIVKGIGLSPKKINPQVYEAAKDLGIELPAAVVSRSKALDLADSFVGKTPIAGDILHSKYNQVGTKITEELNKVYDKIIPQAELKGVEDRISKLYNKAETTVPQNGAIKPTNFTKKIGEVENKIGKGYFTSDEEKEVLGIIDTIKKNVAGDIESAPIGKLVSTKRSLNKQITWDKSDGYRDLLKGVQKSINEDIKTYAKTSGDAKDWYKFYADADGLFGKVKTREELEFLLSGKATNYATGDLSHNNLSKTIHDPKTRGRIEKLINRTDSDAKETLSKIKNIGTVARAITIKNKNVPNPSGTANVAAIASILGGVVYRPLSTVATVGATGVLTNILTNQKFLDSAYNALRGNKEAISLFNKTVQEITGSSVTTLSKEIEKTQLQNSDTKY